jgi:hypothetical protein
LAGRNYDLGRVVERGGDQRFRVTNLKVVYGILENTCSERVESCRSKDGIGEQ